MDARTARTASGIDHEADDVTLVDVKHAARDQELVHGRVEDMGKDCWATT